MEIIYIYIENKNLYFHLLLIELPSVECNLKLNVMWSNVSIKTVAL